MSFEGLGIETVVTVILTVLGGLTALLVAFTDVFKKLGEMLRALRDLGQPRRGQNDPPPENDGAPPSPPPPLDPGTTSILRDLVQDESLSLTEREAAKSRLFEVLGIKIDPTAAAEPNEQQLQEAREEAVEDLLDDPDEQEIVENIEEGDTGAAFKRLEIEARELESAALQAQAETEDKRANAAAAWLRIGLLAYEVDSARALKAFEKVVQLNPSDVWATIYAARLAQTCGDLHRARRFLETALHPDAVSDRDHAALHDGLGDVARAEGDLAAARGHYEESLEIDRALSASDPSSASARRDVSVSLNKLGDVAVAEGDLAAARGHYEESLEIGRALSASDPSSASARRDLAISHERVGMVALNTGDRDAARKNWEQELEIAHELAGRDPTNSDWPRFIAVVRLMIADLGEEDADAQKRQAFDLLHQLVETRRLAPRDREMYNGLKADLGE